MIVFAFLLFSLSSILIKHWTAISLLPAAVWPLLTSAQRALLSYTCLQDCVIFPACTNTSKWLSLLRWRTWLTSCLFATISPSPSMCLSCKCSKSLPPSCFTLSFPSPILSSEYQSIFWPFWCFFLCRDKLICFLPLALREGKLMGCLCIGNQLPTTSIIFSFSPVCVLLIVNGFFSNCSTFLFTSLPLATLLLQGYFLNCAKLCLSPSIKKIVCCLFLSCIHIFFYPAPNRGESL